MPETAEVKLRVLFAMEKSVFMEDLNFSVGFMIFYHNEILTLAQEYGVSLLIHKPKTV